MRKIIAALFLGVLLCFVGACTTIDCSINNVVLARYKLNRPIGDTLSISVSQAGGNDTTLLNRVINVDSFAIPMSYNREQDVYYLKMSSTTSTIFDTITVNKTNTPHFESVDCSPAFFHEILHVSTTHNKIDSVSINNPNVTYDNAKANFIIYLKSNIF